MVKFFLIISFLCSAPVLADAETELFLFEYPPYVMQNETGRLSGIFHDVLQESMEKVNIKVKIRVLPAARIKHYFVQGKSLAWPAEMASLEGLLKKADLIEVPLFMAYAVFLSLKERKLPDVKMNELEKNLRGKKIVHIRGFEKDFIAFKKAGAELMEVTSYEQMANVLLSKRADYGGVSEVSAYYFFSKNNLLQRVTIHPHLFAFPVGMIFKRSSSELAKKLSQGLDKLKLSGRYYQIINSYLKEMHHPNSKKIMLLH